MFECPEMVNCLAWTPVFLTTVFLGLCFYSVLLKVYDVLCRHPNSKQRSHLFRGGSSKATEFSFVHRANHLF